MKMKRQLTACVLSAALCFSMFPTAEASAAKKVSLSTKKLTVTKGKSKTLKVKNAKKKVTWKVISGKKKFKCTVTVKDVMKVKKPTSIPKPAKKPAPTASVKPMVTSAPPSTTPPEKTERPTGTPASSATVEPTAPAAETEQPTGTPASSATAEPTAPAAETEQPTETPASSASPDATGAPVVKNEKEVAALKKMIAEQKALGAEVSEEDIETKSYLYSEDADLYFDWVTDRNGFYWDTDGNLRGIQLYYCGLNGKISLEEFSHVLYLNCGLNQLTAVDVTENKELRSLECNANRLTALDVTGNKELRSLECNANQLTALDVTGDTKLTSLDCHDNQLTALDVTSNKELTKLDCGVN